jgi:hypothetical protein
MKKQSRSINAKFGTLTVLSVDPSDIGRVLARCGICGQVKSFLSSNLVGGRSRSCGSLACIAKVRAQRLAAVGEKEAA